MLSTDAAIRLYYAPDNASLIVRMALEELGTPYETVLVDRSRRQQQSPEYLTLNPNGMIPACVIDGVVMFETGAILLALSDTFRALAPAPGTGAHRRFLSWLFCLSNGLHAELRLLFYPQHYIGEASRQHADWHRHTLERLRRKLQPFETACAEAGNGAEAPYFFGEMLTVIDLYLACCLRWVQLYPADAPERIALEDYPALRTLLRELEKRPAIRKACAAEGIGAHAFTRPDYANPQEGSAL